MHRFRTFMAKTGAAALAASMIFQTTAFAAPAEELGEIFRAQSEAQTQPESLLSEFLGASKLGEAMKENGFSVQVKAGLLPETIGMAGVEGILSEDSHISFGFRNDPNQHRWQFDAGAGLTEESLLDMSLYGDENCLALSLPQFFAGALSLHAGSLKEQYGQAALAQILGEIPEDFPDIQMSFYPSGSLTTPVAGAFDQLKDEVFSRAIETVEQASVEKEEKGDTSVYTVTVSTEDILKFYESYMAAYVSALSELGIAGTETLESEMEEELSASWQESLASLEQAMGEELSVDITVKDGLIQGYHFESMIALDNTGNTEPEYEEMLTGETAGTTDTAVTEESEAATDAAVAEEPETVTDAAVAEESEAVTDAAVAEESEAVTDTAVAEEPEAVTDAVVMEETEMGYMTCDFTYADPSDPGKGLRYKFTMSTGYDTATILCNIDSVINGTVQTYSGTYDVYMWSEDMNSLMIIPFTATFDAQTGDLNADVEFTDGADSIQMKLDSTFRQPEEGSGFIWTVDELSMSSMGETLGVSGEVSVTADPGELAAPEEERVVLEMTEGELVDLVNEVLTNVNVWAGQFVPQDSATDAVEAALEDQMITDAGEFETETESALDSAAEE
ncbi:hypothetical protein [Parablautia sp. Marseille-Q6255]|uniref:hypothetical protein n=1 Tax=Parablautia sp. Marseille-Q6255 TaxID=3039593 RepID=UPI0024BCDFB4|nr:hypothetical protein [Parablautia sp. Marseille-Q6255]